MALEGDSTPPTEVAVGDNPSPLHNTETPLSSTVPGSDTNQTPVAKPCPECMRGFYCGECNVSVSLNEPSEQEDDSEFDETDTKIRRNKPDSALKDQQSTGRKRAAKLYPLDRLAKCEWEAASETNPMGGGTVPITMTCTKTRNGNGLQQQRHHGPSKNTLDNEPDNVHRICNYHHAWWHALNDADYDWSKHNDIRRD